MEQMILTERQICSLRLKTKQALLDALYRVEDDTSYSSHKISRTIDFLQNEIDADICYEIYHDIYLDSFCGECDGRQPVSFEEFYNNEWQNSECKNWYLSIYEKQNEE